MNSRSHLAGPLAGRTLVCLVAACLAALPASAANWSVSRVNHLTLTPPAGVTVAEMSGVTYLGPAVGGRRFLAAQQMHGALLQFDLTLSPAGALTAISNIASIPISLPHDFEGIAYANVARNSVFLSEESDEGGPRVWEVSLATGDSLQTVTSPTVFTANMRPNLGFESLARSPDGTTMWTANEQALTVDGPIATASAGTLVRLLRLDVAGNSVAPAGQFVYEVEPIHGGSAFGSPQSGLSDLVALPDGTLLALERSVAFTSPLYLNRVYEVDFSGATDVSVGGPANGLNGQSFTPVGKDLLWSGPADGGSGQNLEGLTLGPQLANGDWVLIGVVDDGDDFSGNTIVAFTAAANPSADFDADGDADGADFLAWQRGIGTSMGAAHSQGDANRDGAVDGADLDHWRASVSAAAAQTTIPEPASAAMTATAALALLAAAGRRRPAAPVSP